jgi:hypothetical protein
MVVVLQKNDVYKKKTIESFVYTKNLIVSFLLLNKETLLVQLVEHWSPKPNVVGSSPTGRVVKR